MTATVHQFPPPKPVFDAILPSDQRIQIEEGLKVLLRQPGDPVVYRKGLSLYLPYANGKGVTRAKRSAIQQFIMSNFEMVDISVATKRNPNPPPRYRAIHSSVTAWLENSCPEFVPVLERVNHMPVFVELLDDEVDDVGHPAVKRLHLLCKPGYNSQAKTIYAPSEAFAAIDFDKNQFPSAKAAYEYLRHELLADCLVGPADNPAMIAANEAALLAALVTPAIKSVVGLVPGMLFWAESMSAGKTLFAGVVETIYTGHTPDLLGWGSSEQEREWAIAARLKHEPAVVVIDNVKSNVQSGLLDRLLTSKTLSIRSVGEASNSFKNTAMWIISANNPQLDKDAVNRFLPVQFRQHSAYKTGQYTHPDLHGHILEQRHRILGAIYQIIRAGEAWTDPSELQSEIPPSWGKFPQWTDRMWRICRAVGLDGFLGQSATAIAESLQDQQVNELLAMMHKIRPTNWTLPDIIEVINTIRLHDTVAFNHLPFMEKVRLQGNAIVSIDPIAFGVWVQTNGPMDHGGLKLEKYRSGGKTVYRVVAL